MYAFEGRTYKRLSEIATVITGTKWNGPKASLLYINAETVLETILSEVRAEPDVKLVVSGLSSSPFIDLAGAKMLHDLHGELASRGIAFQIVCARGQVRDVLQADGLAEKTDSANWTRQLDSLLSDLKPG